MREKRRNREWVSMEQKDWGRDREQMVWYREGERRRGRAAKKDTERQRNRDR